MKARQASAKTTTLPAMTTTTTTCHRARVTLWFGVALEVL
jgi:hypothetical protein